MPWESNCLGSQEERPAAIGVRSRHGERCLSTDSSLIYLVPSPALEGGNVAGPCRAATSRRSCFHLRCRRVAALEPVEKLLHPVQVLDGPVAFPELNVADGPPQRGGRTVGVGSNRSVIVLYSLNPVLFDGVGIPSPDAVVGKVLLRPEVYRLAVIGDGPFIVADRQVGVSLQRVGVSC